MKPSIMNKGKRSAESQQQEENDLNHLRLLCTNEVKYLSGASPERTAITALILQDEHGKRSRYGRETHVVVYRANKEENRVMSCQVNLR